MTSFSQQTIRGIVGTGTLAGLTGGFAEIVWIWIYAVMSHIDSASVARGVSQAVGLETLAGPVVLGIAVHMTLAAALGIALAFAMQPLLARWGRGKLVMYATVTAALAMVWAVNFLVVLPVLSPSFVGLVPYEVSLLSKILLGVSAAAVLGIRLRLLSRRPHREIAPAFIRHRR
jgi:hypothetical protein